MVFVCLFLVFYRNERPVVGSKFTYHLPGSEKLVTI
jgi:hypothetical protein